MALSFDKNRIKILLLENVSETARTVFEQHGYSGIETKPDALSDDALARALQGVHILGIRSRTQLTKEVIDAAPKLVAVGCFCIGTNQVDIQAATARGIPIFNAPFSNTRSVAELTLSSAIALIRKIPAKNAALHRGEWLKNAEDSHEARNRTIGIVGYGNIGSQLSILAEQLGMRVVYYDVIKKLPLGNATPCATMEELLEKSDVVTLHVPETEQTKLLMNKGMIERMKPGAVLINYSRGTVVNIDALTEALKTGRLGGCAIDVFPEEPRSKDEEFTSPLRAIDSALLTPHIGGSTEEAQVAIGTEVADKLVHYLDNGTSASAVGFPQVTLPQHTNAYRILNIHSNVPGVLQRLNAVFAGASVNVVGQFLQTNDQIGYVVTDIEATGDPERFRKELRYIPGSIRTRILH